MSEAHAFMLQLLAAFERQSALVIEGLQHRPDPDALHELIAMATNMGMRPLAAYAESLLRRQLPLDASQMARIKEECAVAALAFRDAVQRWREAARLPLKPPQSADTPRTQAP